MTRVKHFSTHPKIVRDNLLAATELADQIQEIEKKLVKTLYDIDCQRFYVRFGYKSLMGFCNHGLKFSKTQSQRIVTRVRNIHQR